MEAATGTAPLLQPRGGDGSTTTTRGRARRAAVEWWVESKKLWNIVGPAIFQRIALYGINVVTQAFIGHLGDLELAAFSIASTVVAGFNFGFLLSPFISGKAHPWVTEIDRIPAGTPFSVNSFDVDARQQRDANNSGSGTESNPGAVLHRSCRTRANQVSHVAISAEGQERRPVF